MSRRRIFENAWIVEKVIHQGLILVQLEHALLDGRSDQLIRSCFQVLHVRSQFYGQDGMNLPADIQGYRHIVSACHLAQILEELLGNRRGTVDRPDRWLDNFLVIPCMLDRVQFGFIRILRAHSFRIHTTIAWMNASNHHGCGTRGPSFRPQTPTSFPLLCSVRLLILKSRVTARAKTG